MLQYYVQDKTNEGWGEKREISLESLNAILASWFIKEKVIIAKIPAVKAKVMTDLSNGFPMKVGNKKVTAKKVEVKDEPASTDA